MSEEKISNPIGVQSADVLEWSRSLRDRSLSPVRNTTRSRSPSPASSARKQTPRKGNTASRAANSYTQAW